MFYSYIFSIIFPEILKLIMSGRMGLAIEQTMHSYPGLLDNNQNLLFMLKCRQFIEMVNGCDFDGSSLSSSSSASSRTSPVQTSVIQSTKAYQNGATVSLVGGPPGSTQSNGTLISDQITSDNHEGKTSVTR